MERVNQDRVVEYSFREQAHKQSFKPPDTGKPASEVNWLQYLSSGVIAAELC